MNEEKCALCGSAYVEGELELVPYQCDQVVCEDCINLHHDLEECACCGVWCDAESQQSESLWIEGEQLWHCPTEHCREGCREIAKEFYDANPRLR